MKGSILLDEDYRESKMLRITDMRKKNNVNKCWHQKPKITDTKGSIFPSHIKRTLNGEKLGQIWTK